MEQEFASVIKFILSASDNPAPYYYNVPQDFIVPAAYFPPPEIESDGHTLSQYSLTFSWFIKFFHKDTQSAHTLCLKALTALQTYRNTITVIDKQGRPIDGRTLKLRDPRMRVVDDGAVQLTLMWTSPRAYFYEEQEKVESLDIGIHVKGAFDSAVSQINKGE